MNRDQTIIKTIQKLLLKCFWKIEKTIGAFTVEAAQARNRPSPLGARDARAFGPTADSQDAKPAWRRAPLGPYLAHSPAAVPSRPSPTIKIGRLSALFAGTKLGDDVSPANPRLILPLCLLSPRNGGSHGARERSGGAAAGPLASARAPLCGSTPLSSGLAVVPFLSPRMEKQPESTGGGSDLCRRAGPLLSSRAAGDRRWSLWLNPGKAPPPFFS